VVQNIVRDFKGLCVCACVKGSERERVGGGESRSGVESTLQSHLLVSHRDRIVNGGLEYVLCESIEANALRDRVVAVPPNGALGLLRSVRTSATSQLTGERRTCWGVQHTPCLT
jgi:hypothetical protein